MMLRRGKRENISTVKGKTTPAKKIPYWLWVTIAKSLGIKLHEKDKPVISAVLHILTFGSALGLFVTNAWYSGYNIVSVRTKSDILDGTVSIIVMSYFCGLGVYAHRLAYRLFVHPKFLDMLRLHSKTIMKINSALVIFFILGSFVIVLNISTVNYSYPYIYNSTEVVSNFSTLNPCQLVDVYVGVCQVYWSCQVVFSIFFLAWNLLVAVVLVSVARTQTISIRRFLKELEQDAVLLDRQLLSNYSRSEGRHENEFVWRDEDLVDFFTVAKAETDSNSVNISQTDSFADLQLQIGEEEISSAPGAPGVQADPREGPSVTSTSRFRHLSESDNEETASEPHVMPSQEIMHKYWRINMSVRLASVALQRWMSSIVFMITAWSAIRMVYWLSHTATLYGVFMFILPLLLLPLLASSYAEVNYEGGKILQSILPTEGRVPLFQYLYGQPIQMSVYGHAVTYGTIGTVVAGIVAAFVSKIFLQEINDL
ncbi:uncharacterized protein LOC111708736 [Eurytemora carolleeae]|uniref:uncharacterized protein LOC111708736 n=1 Tax=Eurytemora carolleeae TaxID=1294199 RepID=UPI000C784856|nr:uncharacterized protein LOC111708736 [Eurytemora carolleeae]XP_023337963.1 uncharacterized protein LOC111708736 [Eurytemora carolleeae]|eukprot:XP_023337962.1 uncharacterized protein LOC111708736 [Eurytemora affinis]